MKLCVITEKNIQALFQKVRCEDCNQICAEIDQNNAQIEGEYAQLKYGQKNIDQILEAHI